MPALHGSPGLHDFYIEGLSNSIKRQGEMGISVRSMGVGDTASTIAFAIAAGAEAVAPSPAPFTPSGFRGVGCGLCRTVIGGTSSATGRR